jgi:hypothetical protein
MGEAERRLKANKVIAGKRCGWCREGLTLGEDAAVCNECRLLHHASCWDHHAGCARPGCVNAPLQQVQEAVPAAPGRPPPIGKVHCSNCGKAVAQAVGTCPFCNTPLRRSVRRRPRRYRGSTSKAERMPSVADWVICILCPGIGCIIGIVALIQGETKRGGIMVAVGGGLAVVGTLLRLAAQGGMR